MPQIQTATRQVADLILTTINGDKNAHMAFGHWIPASIPLFALSVETFPSLQDVYLTAAQKAGEALWQDGLGVGPLLKEKTAYQGGYLLHSLYKMYEVRTQLVGNQGSLAVTWKTRAFMFARALIDQVFIQAHLEFKNSKQQPTKQGLTDHPFSSIENVSGSICFLSDLLRSDEGQVCFPGYEV